MTTDNITTETEAELKQQLFESVAAMELTNEIDQAKTLIEVLETMGVQSSFCQVWIEGEEENISSPGIVIPSKGFDNLIRIISASFNS